LVRWQSSSRTRRNAGLKPWAFGLALIGGAVAVADLTGGLELAGAVGLIPLGLILPWASMTAVAVIRSSLDWVAG